MATMLPPQKGVEYITYVTLTSQANIKLMQSNPTLAAGDVKVSTDDGALSNLDTLPSVSPAGSYFVKVTVSAAEMNGDNANIHFHDVAGNEWCDLAINIPTSGQSLNAIDALIDTLIARFTAARAGYLDNLSAGAVALEATLTAIGLVVVAIDARLPADPADQSLLVAHITAEVDDLITRVKGLNAIYDSVALRALEATLTAIKGAGWNAATDTLEKIRDAIIGIADLIYAPDASSVIATGNEIANTYAACAIDNAVRWQIEDTGAGDGLDVICEFNLATSRRATAVHINGYFNGAGGPVEIYVYNYISASWNKLSAGTPGTEMRNRANDRDYVFPLVVGNTDLTTSPGEVKIRFLTKSSNAGDDLYLDYVGVVATATLLPEVIANAVWEFNVEDIRHLVTGEYTAGHVIKRLVALGTDVAVEDSAISFTLSDGITRDDAYPDMLIEVRDESSATRDIEIRRIIGWTAAKVVIVDRAFSFTPTVGDHVHITCGYLGISALEATLTAIKGAGWTNETLKLIKELVDELESGEKPPRKASFRM